MHGKNTFTEIRFVQQQFDILTDIHPPTKGAVVMLDILLKSTTEIRRLEWEIF